jgi:hypothetical protein
LLVRKGEKEKVRTYLGSDGRNVDGKGSLSTAELGLVVVLRTGNKSVEVEG